MSGDDEQSEGKKGKEGRVLELNSQFFAVTGGLLLLLLLLFPPVAVVGGLLLLFELLLSAKANGAAATTPTASTATANMATMKRAFEPIMSSPDRGCFYKKTSGILYIFRLLLLVQLLLILFITSSKLLSGTIFTVLNAEIPASIHIVSIS